MTNMEFLHKIIANLDPFQFFYAVIAITGGVSRYLGGFTRGEHFSLSVFFASAFISGFSGWMFALMGSSMNMPQGVLFIMAGTGGFFGDQTMKFILEWVKGRAH